MGTRSIVAAVILAWAGAAPAATYKVTKTADTDDGACDADCSLREAVSAANANTGRDTILLQGRIYELGLAPARDPGSEDPVVDEDENRDGDLDIRDDLLMKGRPWFGVPATVIDANRLHRVVEVLPGVKVELRDIELRGGLVADRGAGLANYGTTRLIRMRIADNVATSGFSFGDGGGIYNAGRLVINYSKIEGNDAGGGEASYGEGGGIYNAGSLYVNETLVAGNSTHDDNDAGYGGGLMNLGYAQVERSLFTLNTTSSNGSGGAIFNRAGATLDVRSSTLSGNHSGEVFAGGAALANGNPYDDAGGNMTLSSVTIADNGNGGVFNRGQATLVNTIVGGNYEAISYAEPSYDSGNNCRNFGDSFGMLTTSVLLGDDGNCVGDIVVDNAGVIGSVLGALSDNGGGTATHLPVINGPAVDASQSTCPALDQRRLPRPVDLDGDGEAECDIGAVERQAGE
jgi:CSLREA domain-containing protein